MDNKLTREYLIQLTQKSVVKYTDWNDRDSFIAQNNIKFVNAGLVSGLDFEAGFNDYDSIYIKFINLTEEIVEKANNFLLSYNSLEIDAFSDYVEAYPENEMFYSSLKFFKENDLCCIGYIPTEERILNAGGGDWY